MQENTSPIYTEFLPISRADMEARGWDQLDFVVVGGDAYVDHPSFGTAIISRLLEAEGCDLSQGVVVVSNGFHLTRARMLAERAGYDSVSTLAAPSSHLPSRLHMYVREPLALVKSFFLDR